MVSKETYFKALENIQFLLNNCRETEPAVISYDENDNFTIMLFPYSTAFNAYKKDEFVCGIVFEGKELKEEVIFLTKKDGKAQFKRFDELFDNDDQADKFILFTLVLLVTTTFNKEMDNMEKEVGKDVFQQLSIYNKGNKFRS